MFLPSGVTFSFNFGQSATRSSLRPHCHCPPSIFRLKRNESEPPPRLCSFWHPTKLIASAGIGLEGLVLFWHFFQERPSITWSIVLVTDLSLLDSRLVAEWWWWGGQMLQRYWKFAGYIIIWARRSHDETERRRFVIMISEDFFSLVIIFSCPEWGDLARRAETLTDWVSYWYSLLSLCPTDHSHPHANPPGTKQWWRVWVLDGYFPASKHWWSN